MNLINKILKFNNTIRKIIKNRKKQSYNKI